MRSGVCCMYISSLILQNTYKHAYVTIQKCVCDWVGATEKANVYTNWVCCNMWTLKNSYIEFIRAFRENVLCMLYYHGETEFEGYVFEFNKSLDFLVKLYPAIRYATLRKDKVMLKYLIHDNCWIHNRNKCLSCHLSCNNRVIYQLFSFNVALFEWNGCKSGCHSCM